MYDSALPVRDPRRQNALCTNAAIATPFDGEALRPGLKRDAREASISPRARPSMIGEPDRSATSGERRPAHSIFFARAISGPTTLSSRFDADEPHA